MPVKIGYYIVAASLVLGVEMTAQTQSPRVDLASLDPLAQADPNGTQEWRKVKAADAEMVKAFKEKVRANDSARNTDATATAIARADAAKKFYQTYPKHPSATEARKLEIFALMDGDEGGDGFAALDARLNAASRAFRRDKNLPERERVAVAGAVDFHGAGRSPKTRAAFAAACEQVARDLIAEFPAQPAGYESLLALAAQRDNDRGADLAREVASTATIPSVRLTAARLSTRLGLKGRNLADILPSLAQPVSAPGNSIAKSIPVGASGRSATGPLTIIYSWSVNDPASLATARLLGQRRVDRARWIGVNLDAKSSHATAQKIAIEGGFPGTQIYDELGLEGATATTLGFGPVPAALLVASDGEIGDVYLIDDIVNTLGRFGL